MKEGKWKRKLEIEWDERRVKGNGEGEKGGRDLFKL